MPIDLRPATARAPGWAGVLLAVPLLVGCARPPLVPLDRLIEEASQNEIATYARLEGRKVTTEGVLVDAGMLDSRPRTVTVQYGAVIGIDEDLESHPYLILIPGAAARGQWGGSVGRLVCFFHRRHIGELAGLPRGSMIVVRGRFQEVARQPTHVDVVLHDCELEEPY